MLYLGTILPHIDNHCIPLTSPVVASTNQRRVPIRDSADRLLATITLVITANLFYLYLNNTLINVPYYYISRRVNTRALNTVYFLTPLHHARYHCPICLLSTSEIEPQGSDIQLNIKTTRTNSKIRAWRVASLSRLLFRHPPSPTC
jgi:hypothetical protein